MGKKDTTVSAIIPTYNRSDSVGRAIQSVLDQTYQDFELIIVDDGSTDSTEEVIKSFDDERIVYLSHDENKGKPAAARNTGIKEARGEYIAFLDSDDEWLPKKLEKQMQVMCASSESVGVVYCFWKRFLIDGSIKEYTPKLTNRRDARKRLFNLQIGPGPPSVLIKSECFEKVGLFDEDLSGWEGHDLWIRISEYYDFAYIPEFFLYAYETKDRSKNPTKARMEILYKHKKLFLEHNKSQYVQMLYNIGRESVRIGFIQEGIKCIKDAIEMRPLSLRYRISLMMANLGIRRFKYFI